MPGRHTQAATSGRVRIWLVGLAVAATAGLLGLLAGPAAASSQTVNAQLSLSGLASADNPLGGSTIGVRPGDEVTFAAAGAPTAGLAKLGLNGLVDNILGLGGTFQITADFSGLPGGAKNTVLSGPDKAAFAFPKKGTYSFTWSAQRVTILGVVPIDLSGNQLARAGVKLNASNDYVGKIVVATHPPQGGLSVQVPSVKVAPSAPVVGQLPTISIPGVQAPTVTVPVPDLNPTGGSTSAGGGSGTSSAPTSVAPSEQPDYTPPALSIPQMVVPGGYGAGDNGGNGGGGFRLGVAGVGSPGQFSVGQTGSGIGKAGSTSGAEAPGVHGPTGKTVDLASSSTSSPSGQLPVLLAILAVITLAVVAGTYARLYLLGRKTHG